MYLDGVIVRPKKGKYYDTERLLDAMISRLPVSYMALNDGSYRVVWTNPIVGEEAHYVLMQHGWMRGILSVSDE